MSITVTGLAPLLAVFDMSASLAFYRDLLGFEVIEAAGPPDDIGWALLRLGKTELMLNTLYEKPDRPPALDPRRHAAHLDTTIYFGCPDVDAAYEHLIRSGLRAEKPMVAAYGMKQLYLRDPDGYNLCFQWPATPESRDIWRER